MALNYIMMKKTLLYILCGILAISTTGCKKDNPAVDDNTVITPENPSDNGNNTDTPTTPPVQETLKDKICGEWHFTSETDNADIRIALNADGSYELYQKFEGGVHHLYRGKWTLNENVLSGTYNDGETWQTSYTVSISDDKSTLTLVTGTDSYVYLREPILDSIKDTCIIVVKSGIL